jgi:hypothetical protein
MQVGQRPSVDLDARLQNHEPEAIVPVDTPLEMSYVEQLAFNEDKIKIRIHPSTEKHAPKVAECWVNGEPAEVWINGRWVKMGYMPIGQELITKRKYVEVLARAKHDTVTTEVVKTAEDEQNLAHRFTSVKYSFSVLADPSPRGAEWLTRLLAEG